MMAGAIRLHPNDSVAVVLTDADPGCVEVRGGATLQVVELLQPISAGHKVALVPHTEGSAVLKYGSRIGRATRNIQPGEWVHLHNCASDFDERSNALDPITGLPCTQTVIGTTQNELQSPPHP